MSVIFRNLILVALLFFTYVTGFAIDPDEPIELEGGVLTLAATDIGVIGETRFTLPFRNGTVLEICGFDISATNAIEEISLTDTNEENSFQVDPPFFPSQSVRLVDVRQKCIASEAPFGISFQFASALTSDDEITITPLSKAHTPILLPSAAQVAVLIDLQIVTRMDNLFLTNRELRIGEPFEELDVTIELIDVDSENVRVQIQLNCPNGDPFIFDFDQIGDVIFIDCFDRATNRFTGIFIALKAIFP